MADCKITSIAGLKKAIKGTVWVGVGTTEDILRVIGEFEASVRERCDELKGLINFPEAPNARALVIELRRIVCGEAK